MIPQQPSSRGSPRKAGAKSDSTELGDEVASPDGPSRPDRLPISPEVGFFVRWDATRRHYGGISGYFWSLAVLWPC